MDHIEQPPVNPLCVLFGSCGGCTAQHISYALQVENKQKLVSSILAKAKPEWTGPAVIVAGEPYGYRNRMDFVLSPFITGVGLREKGKWWKIIPVASCPISNSGLNDLLREVNDWLLRKHGTVDPFDIKKNHGTMRYAVIRTNKDHTDSSVSFMLSEDSSKLQAQIEEIRSFAEMTSAKNVAIAYTPAKSDMSTSGESFSVKGNEYLIETLLGKEMRFPIQGFFQNNPVMAEKMMQHVRETLEYEHVSNSGDYLVDLYGGVGTFALAAGELFSAGITIESFEESTRYARENLDANQMGYIEAICLDAASLKKIELDKKAQGKRLVMILDPPRSGMHPKTIEELRRLNPKIIIYISCNPEQLGKEIVHFKNHVIDSVTVFDLFPQTPHVETVVVMKANVEH
jgi:tRNA (uracil-5-)-methyltransferase